MSAHDRKVVHTTLAEHPGVRTESEGEGPARRVVIFPSRGRPRLRRASEQDVDVNVEAKGGGERVGSGDR